MADFHQAPLSRNIFLNAISKSEIETLFGLVIKKVHVEESSSPSYNLYSNGELVLEHQSEDFIRHAFEILALKVAHTLIDEADEEAE